MTHTSLTKLTLLLSSLAVAACAAQTPTAARPSMKPSPASEPVKASVDRDAVRAALAAKRQVQIDRLRAYSNAGIFPKNREQPGLLNIFIDGDGTICAAANLMAQDGLLTLVKDTAAADNYLRLATVTDGPLMDWMLGSGLTQDEIDAVQEPYMGEMREPFEPALEPAIAAATEVSRLQAHFAAVLAQLEATWDASLDAATDRLLSADPALVASL